MSCAHKEWTYYLSYRMHGKPSRRLAECNGCALVRDAPAFEEVAGAIKPLAPERPTRLKAPPALTPHGVACLAST